MGINYNTYVSNFRTEKYSKNNKQYWWIYHVETAPCLLFYCNSEENLFSFFIYPYVMIDWWDW